MLDEVIRVVGLARPLVVSIGARDRDLASQVRRALSSVALNVAEGFGSSGGTARARFESARGSLYEAHTGLRVAVAWGYVSPASSTEVLGALNALGGRVRGLARQ